MKHRSIPKSFGTCKDAQKQKASPPSSEARKVICRSKPELQTIREPEDTRAFGEDFSFYPTVYSFFCGNQQTNKPTQKTRRFCESQGSNGRREFLPVSPLPLARELGRTFETRCFCGWSDQLGGEAFFFFFKGVLVVGCRFHSKALSVCCQGKLRIFIQSAFWRLVIWLLCLFAICCRELGIGRKFTPPKHSLMNHPKPYESTTKLQEVMKMNDVPPLSTAKPRKNSTRTWQKQETYTDTITKVTKTHTKKDHQGQHPQDQPTLPLSIPSNRRGSVWVSREDPSSLVEESCSRGGRWADLFESA